jgi:uncharacterized SAM-binding protein YcdF (DUF218 family)
VLCAPGRAGARQAERAEGRHVDVDAPPRSGQPVALVLFGTNQAAPAQIAAERYRRGEAPLIIATGGVNRHTGIIEGREFARQLHDVGVPPAAIRTEDQTADTWQNGELSMPHLREALASGLRLAVVSKWYHRRAVMALHTRLPEAGPLHAIAWEPAYAGTLVTRENWLITAELLGCGRKPLVERPRPLLP